MMDFLEKVNYVHRIETLVIVGVVLFTAYVFYSLQLFKKDKG